ncbi:hypothetical protein MLD38_007185 [Melastoma candidum]|uniref:Uncharacterized protein n=1 Tax=Melastoma candidum TaxID=119954 RepID=A0ACB9RS77_9MYRT|nr:hypothetical protein MLD38_007185 [Melastoma candidum]
MVQLMNSAEFELGGDNEKAAPLVKVEFVEDPSEDEHGSLHKRSRTSSGVDQRWGTGAKAVPVPPSNYNPLEEPSPLGLRLRKSPSLLDLIQMKLSQGDTNLRNAQSENLSAEEQMDSKGSAALCTSDKMKASNFPASLLRIGQWEYKSRYEGDLVAKCYFAKHKLVWEVLEGGLKSKIEIQWSDIVALKAHCPDDGPSTLKVVLSRQPLFFRETNPQPRKHTLWQATSDFTDGQASIHRQHFLECQPGLLAKHFEKLIQCDMRLGFLSRQPEIILDSPLFDPRPSVFEGLEEPKGLRFDNVESDKLSNGADVHLSPLSGSLSSKNGHQDLVSMESDTSGHIHSSFSGNMRSEGVGIKASKNWDQIKVPGLYPSMSMSDLMNHIGHCISEQMGSGSSSLEDSTECQGLLEGIAQYLLSDSQVTTASDEKSLMARVNSLCCLLQKDTPVVSKLQSVMDSSEERSSDRIMVAQPKDDQGFAVEGKWIIDASARAPEEVSKDATGSKQTGGMSRKDSFGELLMHLPRITSLPKFLFNISEEDSESNSR